MHNQRWPIIKMIIIIPISYIIMGLLIDNILTNYSIIYNYLTSSRLYEDHQKIIIVDKFIKFHSKEEHYKPYFLLMITIITELNKLQLLNQKVSLNQILQIRSQNQILFKY
ncbi:hypothetical protein pb186bvf_002035 [Paramecium bursaria]